MALLEFRSVGFAYGDRRVLDGIDLVVERGEVVAVVGPNGAGKTTLLRVASGLLRPDVGEVRLDGDLLHEMGRRRAARRIAGVGAEEDAGFPYTVRETVSLGRHPWRGTFGRLSARDEALIDGALADADLVTLAHRPLPALSSGERRRSAVARCLVQGGDLVLLDEPTSHLDLGHRLRLLDVIRRRARETGQGALLVLHDLNLAGASADRVVLLVDGHVRACGTPGEVLTARRVGDAFGAEVCIIAHPETGAPVVVPGALEGKP